jgi:phage baseplate assembly protein W
MSDALGAGLAFPLSVDQRGAIALARDETDVAQAIGLILATAPGERPMRPEFGCAVHEHLFDNFDSASLGRIEHSVRVALDRWEPRVEVVSIGFDLSHQDEGLLEVDIGYTIRDVPGVRNLVHPFYVIPDEAPGLPEGEGEIVDAEVVQL